MLSKQIATQPNIARQQIENCSSLLFGRSSCFNREVCCSWVDAVMRADENEMLLHQLSWLFQDALRSLTMILITAERCDMLCCLLKERWCWGEATYDRILEGVTHCLSIELTNLPIVVLSSRQIIEAQPWAKFYLPHPLLHSSGYVAAIYDVITRSSMA